MSSLIAGSILLVAYLALLILAITWMDGRSRKARRALRSSEAKRKLLNKENDALRKTNAEQEIRLIQIIKTMNEHIHGEKVS